MRIFVTGATGYIGGAVAVALIQSGHQVVGLAHNARAESTLAARGLSTVPGSLTDRSALQQGARGSDAVVHAGFARDVDFAEAVAVEHRALGTFLDEVEGSGKPFVYTSGVFTHQTAPVPESLDYDPHPAMAWRVDHEQLVIEASSTGVRSIVIRPSMVHGNGGSAIVTVQLDAARKSGSAVYVEPGTKAMSFVHVSDLAELYVAALDRAPGGTLMNAADGAAVSWRSLAEAVAVTVGPRCTAEGRDEEAVQEALGMAGGGLAAGALLDVGRAETLLGWRPTRPGVIEDVTSGSYRTEQRDTSSTT
jgi:nucleoside-diphosphate-sugar epimerase